jgi:DNA repair protein SbcC/Rad50
MVTIAPSCTSSSPRAMSWFKELLRNPPAKSPAQPVSRSATTATEAAPAVDPDAARAAIAASTDEEQRQRWADDLGRALAGLHRSPLAHDGPAVWAAAVSHVGDKALALQWLASLHVETLLGEVAAHARYAEVRLAAIQRVADPEVLECVARLSRGRDKGVFRHCYDVLRRRRHDAERTRRAAQLRDALHELLARSPMSVTGMLDLQRELQALEDAGESLGECRTLLEEANVRLGHEAEARRGLQARRDEAEELASRCTDVLWPSTEQLDQWRDRFSTLAQAHSGVPEWLSDKPASHAVEVALRQIQARLEALDADGARIQACQQFLSALEAAPVPSGAAGEWQALAKPDRPEIREQLYARWQSLHRAPEIGPTVAPPPEPRTQPQVDLTAVRTLLDRMEHALEDGHLGEADASAKKIKAALGGAALRGGLAARLQRSQARLGELSGWAKWGAEQQREHLIETAEELSSGNHGVEHLASAVPALREEWKRLSGQASAPHGEWERFDAALTKAYRPVAAQRVEEAARRAQARSDKEALCAEWEAFASGVDWERPDYPAIESQRGQFLTRWRAAPLAGFRDERVLRKRFEALLENVDQRLAAARGAEVHRREQLITAAEALREAPDLRAAMAEAKTLQERWRAEASSLRLPRGEEQKLWRRFRGACDTVFARRDAQRAEQAAQREKRAQARVALLDTFAATLETTDANQIKRALAQFRVDWDAAKATAESSNEGLDARARQLQQQAQRRVEALQRDAYRARLEALAQQAAPVEGADPGALDAGRKARQSLLIDLEIALDLPTPDEFAPDRRQRQLERLRNRFQGERQQRPQAEELLARWHATGALPDEGMNLRVAAVVRRLLEQAQRADK